MSKKYRMPTEAELEIMARNGISAEGVSVESRSETMIVLLKYKTRDQIYIVQGDKKWENYPPGSTSSREGLRPPGKTER